MLSFGGWQAAEVRVVDLEARVASAEARTSEVCVRLWFAMFT